PRAAGAEAKRGARRAIEAASGRVARRCARRAQAPCAAAATVLTAGRRSAARAGLEAPPRRHAGGAPRGAGAKRLRAASGPGDRDLVGARGLPEPEVKVCQGAGRVGGGHEEPLRLRAPPRGDADLRAERSRAVRARDRFDPDPAPAAAQNVLEEARRPRYVHDEEVQVAVVVDVGDGAAPPREPRRLEVARVPPLLE